MKHFAPSTALLLAILVMGCGSDSKDSGRPSDKPGTIKLENRTVSGVSQKGPFVTGTSVTVQELSGDSLLQTGISFKGKISNDRGEFSVPSMTLASQYVFMEVNGYYRNEVTGAVSDSPIIMNALADISDRENVNINLLTHLETDRVMHLVTVDGKAFGVAKKQAHDELMQQFGFSDFWGDAEDMNIFGNDDSAAALLAISIIAQGDLAVGNFSERISRISSDFADGTIDNQEIWNQMAIWAISADLQQIRQNMENWGEHVPAFEKYVRAFWRIGLGTCDNVGEITELYGKVLICRADGWDYATTNEMLNDYLGSCNDNEVKYDEKFHSGWYQCQGGSWTKITEQQADDILNHIILHVTEDQTIECSKLNGAIDYTKSGNEMIDYLINHCRLSTYFKSDAFTSSEQKIGAPCFCYGPDCELAGYERPEQGTIIGCKNVQPVAKAVPICLRSFNLDFVKPAIYFPNGMCAVAISKCTTINDKPNYICGFAKFGSLYTHDASGRLIGDENADAEIANFKAEDCPDGTVMAEFEMNISLKIGEERKAKLHVVGCFPGCHSDADCRTGEYDYILQEPGGLHCMTARPNADGEKANVCFDERTVEFSSIGIQTIKAYNFKAE